MGMAKKVVSELLAKQYENAWEAKKRGEPVGWATSIFPQEIPESFGLCICYPENQAAGMGAKKESMANIEVAESAGYSIDLCAYARNNIGFYLRGGNEESELNMPMPDFLLCCNNICNQVIKWYEDLSIELDIPLIMIDTCYNIEDEMSQSRIDYLKAQFEEAIHQLEIISGKKFDPERFSEVMRTSIENGRLWKEAMSLPCHIPSPMNGFDLYNYMALAVCARGKKETTEAYKLLYKELSEAIEEGTSSFRGEEKYRIMMEGIPCWPHLGYKMKAMGKMGVNMTGSVYPDAWALNYEADDLEGMARAYSIMLNNINIEVMAKLRSSALTDGQCDGALYHMNRSCKLMSFIQYEMARIAADETGLPYTGFDGDQADPRRFAQAQFDTRLQGLVEIMEERKEVKEG